MAITTTRRAALLGLTLLCGCSWLTTEHFDESIKKLNEKVAPGGSKIIPKRLQWDSLLTNGLRSPGDFITLQADGTPQLQHPTCESIAKGLVQKTDNARNAPPTQWRDVLARAAAKGDTPLPDALTGPDWLRVGVYFNSFEARASVNGPMFSLSANTATNALSFQAWRAAALHYLDGDVAVALDACCKVHGCADPADHDDGYLVTRVTDLEQYTQQYNSFSVDVAGSYTVYSGGGSGADVSVQQGKNVWRMLELVQLPHKVKALDEVCALPRFVGVPQTVGAIATRVSFYCPLALTFSYVNARAASEPSQDRATQVWTVNVASNSSPGTVGRITLSAAGLPDAEIALVVTGTAPSTPITSSPEGFKPDTELVDGLKRRPGCSDPVSCVQFLVNDRPAKVPAGLKVE